MADELRERIARRLFMASEHLWGLMPSDRVFWLHMADECLRLMEWARRQHMRPYDADNVALTLPPDDWKP